MRLISCSVERSMTQLVRNLRTRPILLRLAKGGCHLGVGNAVCLALWPSDATTTTAIRVVGWGWGRVQRLATLELLYSIFRDLALTLRLR